MVQCVLCYKNGNAMYGAFPLVKAIIIVKREKFTRSVRVCQECFEKHVK